MEAFDTDVESKDIPEVEGYESPQVSDLESPDGPAVTAAGVTVV